MSQSHVTHLNMATYSAVFLISDACFLSYENFVHICSYFDILPSK